MSQIKISRRQFLKRAGLLFAMSQLPACKPRPEEIIPYVKMPERLVPGNPKFYATAMTLRGIARGVLAESHMGRPTRLEGNPQHPESLGAIDPVSQAEIYTFYNPARSKGGLEKGKEIVRERQIQIIKTLAASLPERQGEGFRILMESSASPSLEAEVRKLLRALPRTVVHRFDPVSRDPVYEATARAFGQELQPVYDFTRPSFILSVSGDFLGDMPGALRYSRDYTEQRRRSSYATRLYSIECVWTLTGAHADKRLPVHPDQILPALLYILYRAGLHAEVPVPAESALRGFCDETAGGLKLAGAGGLIIAGEMEDPALQALCHVANSRLGSTAVRYISPVEVLRGETRSINELVEAMRDGSVRTLLVLDSNPVYTAPSDLAFEEAFLRVPDRIHYGLFRDETAARSTVHLPAAHNLEAWGDGKAYDGTVSIVQPLIQPLFDSVSPLELFSLLNSEAKSGYELVRDYWRYKAGGEFEKWWRKSLEDGIISGTASQSSSAAPVMNPDEVVAASQAPFNASSFTLVLCPDHRIWDGRYAENPWLQELPEPFTKLVWDTALFMSQKTADSLQVQHGDQVEIRQRGRMTQAAVFVLPGIADGTGFMTLGYGRPLLMQSKAAPSFNAYLLRTSSEPWVLRGVELAGRGAPYEFVSTQNHFNMQGRDIIHVVKGEDKTGRRLEQSKDPSISLYPPQPQEPYEWGMVIDLSSCIGCGSCVMACQAENNIVSVGKDQVGRSREMHWLRIASYFKGSEQNPQVYFQPIPCMHCETAPCEVVCPVAATSHSVEGLNEQIYNRCVGTRYCSNNCPYKVRRFNFYNYVDGDTEILKMFRNPDVTVRARGVMEKCTYCVQRINEARIRAQRENRRIREEEVRTACQQACPTGAIVFGNIMDRESEVAKARKNPRNYSLLAGLNTRPRTTYLAYVSPIGEES